ncbi:MAG: hypothetical protein HZB25_10725 [Candidatus Eisenbacteria bacterium]|nr:hypothetical protein [Candidatus Eisenbacteria bacterium]
MGDPGPWWGQMITVGYERARGLRMLHQKPDGFEISVSRTLAIPPASAFRAWQRRALESWLPRAGMELQSSSPGRRLRFRWKDGVGRVEVRFEPRPANRSQVSVQHGRLKDAKAGAAMKAFWAAALDRLRRKLEG